MTQPTSGPTSSGGTPDFQDRFRGGARHYAGALVGGAVGVAGVATIVALTASGLAPYLLAAAAAKPVADWLTGVVSEPVLTWIENMGGNVLAGWVGNWATGAGRRFLRGKGAGDPLVDEQALAAALARELQTRMTGDSAFQDAIATLLERTDAIPEALKALEGRMEAQQHLLAALRDDARRGDLIQGRLHRLVMQELGRIEDKLDQLHEKVDRLTQPPAATALHQLRPPSATSPAGRTRSSGWSRRSNRRPGTARQPRSPASAAWAASARPNSPTRWRTA